MDQLNSVEGRLDGSKNIALVQWAQFIEHDLVKTVVRTMGNLNGVLCKELFDVFVII